MSLSGVSLSVAIHDRVARNCLVGDGSCGLGHRIFRVDMGGAVSVRENGNEGDDCDECRDQTVFDSGGAGFVFAKAL